VVEFAHRFILAVKDIFTGVFGGSVEVQKYKQTRRCGLFLSLDSRLRGNDDARR